MLYLLALLAYLSLTYTYAWRQRLVLQGLQPAPGEGRWTSIWLILSFLLVSMPVGLHGLYHALQQRFPLDRPANLAASLMLLGSAVGVASLLRATRAASAVASVPASTRIGYAFSIALAAYFGVVAVDQLQFGLRAGENDGWMNPKAFAIAAQDLVDVDCDQAIMTYVGVDTDEATYRCPDDIVLFWPSSVLFAPWPNYRQGHSRALGPSLRAFHQRTQADTTP
ncbi:hypothetical protein AACH06_25605 [Ideonella sp. DXS29W]|uniref:Uncharacterized protein n=1 Tax=Ideonella lacteola TaxID=2984193 RepID=A0ABU9BZG1_9BURK